MASMIAATSKNPTPMSTELIRTEELLLAAVRIKSPVQAPSELSRPNSSMPGVLLQVAAAPTSVPLPEVVMEDLTVAAYNDDVSTSVPATLQGTNAAIARRIFQRSQEVERDKSWKDFLKVQHQELGPQTHTPPSTTLGRVTALLVFGSYESVCLLSFDFLYIARCEVLRRNPPSIFRWSASFALILCSSNLLIYQKHPN
jgi:hypothetical protein